MASSALVIPTSYHKPTPSIRKSKVETTKVRSEDELLKFFLHGSYDVQRGNMNNPLQIKETNDQKECIKNEPMVPSNLTPDDKKVNSRFMFEETYMINISVKQPDAIPSSKQIDVRIEKTPSDIQAENEKVDDDEVSSIFDEEEENDEIDSVIFNDINSSTSETPPTKLTLADMISKTLTTIPTASTDNLNKSKDTSSLKTASPASIPASLTTNRSEDEKLFKYLDYLKTRDELKVTRRRRYFYFSSFSFVAKTFQTTTITTKTTRSNTNHRSRTTLSFINCE
jgi:hypothetical protein